MFLETPRGGARRPLGWTRGAEEILLQLFLVSK